jgi:hypothetical protein
LRRLRDLIRRFSRVLAICKTEYLLYAAILAETDHAVNATAERIAGMI